MAMHRTTSRNFSNTSHIVGTHCDLPQSLVLCNTNHSFHFIAPPYPLSRTSVVALVSHYRIYPLHRTIVCTPCIAPLYPLHRTIVPLSSYHRTPCIAPLYPLHRTIVPLTSHHRPTQGTYVPVPSRTCIPETIAFMPLKF